MLLKKNRQTLRGLSHQEKVKKLQKLTRVPLQDLKTNIVQSDLQEDDVSVPICLKQQSKVNQLPQTQYPGRHETKGKVFDQQKINRTIRAMTKQLYTLQLGKQISPINTSKGHYRAVSIFSIQGLHSQQPSNSDKGLATKQTLEEFYSTSKNNFTTKNLSNKELSEISEKLDNLQNINFQVTQNYQCKKQIHQRHSQPLFILDTKNEPNDNFFSPNLDLTNKKDDIESQISKRFSRSKRNSDRLNQLQSQKKLKFNRSNQKNRHLNRLINQENDEKIYTIKKVLLTERISFQTIPTYQDVENDFKKRKNIGKNFMTFTNKNLIKEQSFREVRAEQKTNYQESLKNSLKNAIMQYEAISKNQAFKKLQKGIVDEIFLDERGKEFLVQLYIRYRQSIEILTSLK